MNRETRTVRPFLLRDGLDKILDDVVFFLGQKRCEPDGFIVLNNSDEYQRGTPRLAWAKDEAAFDLFKDKVARGLRRNAIDPKAASLVVTAYTGYLKIADILIDHPIDQLHSLSRHYVFNHPNRPRALSASTHGATITAYLLLRQNIKRKPLRPWRKGTWVARATFNLRTGMASLLFRPTPLDDKTREELELPSDCVRYVYIGDHEALEAYDESTPPTFYVDEAVLARLGSEAGTPAGVALQVQLVVDFISAVINNVAAQDRKPHSVDWHELKDSLFGCIVTLVVGKDATTHERDRIIRLAEEDPPKVVALAESALRVRQTTLRLLMDDG